jgi:hypothetical protein
MTVLMSQRLAVIVTALALAREVFQVINLVISGYGGTSTFSNSLLLGLSGDTALL